MDYGQLRLAARPEHDTPAAPPRTKFEDAHLGQTVWLQSIDRLLSLAPRPRGEVWIDVGCGDGTAMAYVALEHDQFSQVIGFDVDHSMVELARQRFKRLPEPARGKLSADQCDAARFIVPSTPLFLFLFNPFGPKTARAFLANNLASMKEIRAVILLANDHLLPVFEPVAVDIRQDPKWNLSVVCL